jgi:hypothetical protein
VLEDKYTSIYLLFDKYHVFNLQKDPMKHCCSSYFTDEEAEACVSLHDLKLEWQSYDLEPDLSTIKALDSAAAAREIQQSTSYEVRVQQR